MLLRKLEDGIRKHRIIGTLVICNVRETIIKEIEQEGFFTNRCLHAYSTSPGRLSNPSYIYEALVSMEI